MSKVVAIFLFSLYFVVFIYPVISVFMCFNCAKTEKYCEPGSNQMGQYLHICDGGIKQCMINGNNRKCLNVSEVKNCHPPVCTICNVSGCNKS